MKAVTGIKIPLWRPSNLDTSVGADLYRIEFNLNYIIKKGDESIGDDDFYDRLKETTRVIKLFL